MADQDLIVAAIRRAGSLGVRTLEHLEHALTFARRHEGGVAQEIAQARESVAGFVAALDDAERTVREDGHD